MKLRDIVKEVLTEKKKKSKLCKRGRDYIAARKRAGEKSSAYLSGRAVKVCKGSIKGAGGKKKKSYKESIDKEDDNRVPGAALILPRGKEVILQAEETDYKRGLLVELTNKGGYKIKYWYGDDVKVYPAEVEVDGKSIKKDAKVVDILFHPELKEAFDELDDGFDPEMEALIKSGPRLNKDRFKDVIYYIHNNWMAGNYGDDYAIRRISKYLNALEENIDPKSQKKHKGKAAPYGSAYQKVEEVEWVDESLRDWFKKEDWVRINTSGNITGPCGTMKKGKATTRCLPRKKAQSLTKAERKATVAKKVRGSKKGKQFVKNTKKSEFKKK